MKYFILSLCLIGTVNVKSQDYIPFPDSTAVWNVFYLYESSFGEASDQYIYLLEGDTLFENRWYSMMYVRKAVHTSSVVPPVYYSLEDYPFELIGGVREDTTKKVWFRHFGLEEWVPEFLFTELYTDTSEIMLYDFNLEIGDSVTTFAESEEYIKTVTSIDIDAYTGRRIYVFDYNSEFPSFGPLIEGIGSIDSSPFARWAINGAIVGASVNLNCFSQNGEQIYVVNGDPSIWSENCDEIHVGLQEFQMQVLEVFPNPASSSLNVRIPQGTVVHHVMLVDAMGRIIEGSKFKVPGSYSNDLESSTLNVESLPVGLYTVLLSTEEGGQYSGKFVKE